MFQSQSNQKGQSGIKQGNQSPDTITSMTLKMLKKIQISQDKKDAVYEDKIINYIQIIARTENVDIQQKKGIFTINDDTGYYQFSMMISSDLDKNIFEILDKEEIKQIYYCFLFRARISKETIIYDVQSVQKVQDSGQILLNILQIINQCCRNHNGNIQQQQQQKNEQTQNFNVIEEEQNKKQTLNLEDKILNHMKAELKEKGTYEVSLTHLINKFTEHDTLQDLKKCLGQMIQNGSLQYGQGVNTYMLAD